MSPPPPVPRSTISALPEHHPVVAAVIVARDGAAWLPDLFRSLAAQTRQLDVVVAVDNASTDATRDVLIDALGPEQVLLSDQDVGFPGAVAMGVDAVPDADHVLVLRDDVVPDPGMVEALVDALVADPRLAVVGPKLVDHDDPELLRSVGFGMDRFGRLDRGLEPGERDQGQFDAARRPLAVSSAVMLVRRHVFLGLGGLDRRLRVTRNDLDFCWRVWTAGWQVGVEPTAVARDRATSTHGDVVGRPLLRGRRFYEERNTLASILKNVPGVRLPLAVLVFVLTAAVRAVWYVLTRRVGDALQTVRAWAWNLRRLPTTLRLRREVNGHRRVAPAALNDKFSHLGPQLRQVLSGVLDQVVGGDLEVEDPVASDEVAARGLLPRLARNVRRHPAATVAIVAGLVGLVVSLPLLWSGPLSLGQLRPFPASGTALVEDYVSVWHDLGPAATIADPSPSEALLGILQILSFDSSWLVSRVLVLGSVVAAWVVSLRAARPLAPTTGPRVAAATVYALSPVSIAAVRTGRIGPMVALVALPAAAVGLHAAVSRRVEPASAWRGAAGAILAIGIGIAFEPALVVPAAVVLVALLVFVLTRSDRAETRSAVATRLLVVLVGVPAVLFPWSLRLLDPSRWWPRSVLPVDEVGSPTWQWLLQAPDQAGFAGVYAGVGLVAAGVFGLLFAARREPGRAGSLAVLALAATSVAVVLDGRGVQAAAWPGLPLLLAAGALAALFALGLRRVSWMLAGHAFGWRQVAAGVLLVAAVAGVGITTLDVQQDGWERGGDAELLPPFIAQAGEEDDFLVLTLADQGGRLTWDLVDDQGPSMADWSANFSSGMEATIDSVVGTVVAQSDPSAAGRLGLLNVRYVVVPEQGRSPELEEGLERQFDLLSQPVAQGLVYTLANDAPPVGATDPDVVSRILATGALPEDAEVRPVPARNGGTSWRYLVGEDPEVMLVATVETGAWEAEAGGRALEPQEVDGLLRFDAPSDSTVVLTPVGQGRRAVLLLLQGLAVFLVISVLLRPPSTRREVRR